MSAKQTPIRILFVCLGNICRSPLAEALFIKLIEGYALNEFFVVDSAGTAAYHIGELPDHRARAVAKERGRILTHRARQVRREDFAQFDYIVAMDHSNYHALVTLRNTLLPSMISQSSAEILLYRAFDTIAPNTDVPDPYYDTIQAFRDVADIVERAGKSFLDYVQQAKDIIK
jgi:protein-tyrosine phosphatase